MLNSEFYLSHREKKRHLNNFNKKENQFDSLKKCKNAEKVKCRVKNSPNLFRINSYQFDIFLQHFYKHWLFDMI